VTHIPGVFTESTAVLAWALLMATARKVSQGRDYVLSGQWDRRAWRFHSSRFP
jgi:lactate dehydrogenase-like 2-hydroxyacid dehydrogenase